MTELQRQIELTQRILGGGVHSILIGDKGHSENPKRDVAVSSSGVCGGATCEASVDDHLATPESRLMALLETVPAGIARVIRAGKESIIDKISMIRTGAKNAD